MAEIRVRTLSLQSLERRAADCAAGKVPIDLPTARSITIAIWEKFNVANDTVLATLVTDDDADYTHQDIFNRGEVAYQKCMSYLKPHPESPTPTIRTEGAPVKLAPIKIQDFKGDCMTWLEFRDQFTVLVHEQDMDPHKKLAYLRMHAQVDMVTGSYAGNYDDLWNMLCERYNDYHMLVKAWHQRFTALPRANDTRDGLMKLVDETRAYIRAHKMMGFDISSLPPIYMQFWEKLPDSAQLAWGLSRQDSKVPTLDECLRYTENRFKNLPTAPLPSPAVQKPRALVGTTSTASKCACKLNHKWLTHCPGFKRMDVPGKKKFLTERKRCISCLWDHDVTECESQYNCRLCDGRHHSWVCPNKENSGPPPNSHPQNVPRH